MRITLIDYTGRGSGNQWYAADLLIFTKNTRIKMSPDGMADVFFMPIEKKMEELTYMANTIRSSWEFVDYTFLFEDVTRAFTHQLVRTRHASYAQQTMQILEVDARNVEPPRGDKPGLVGGIWDGAVRGISLAYKAMLNEGATVEQARGILPTNIRTNIVVKMNLRTVVEVFGQRISPRNLGEYSEVARGMRAKILEVHSWARVFLEQSTDMYLEQLDAELKAIRDDPLCVLENKQRATVAMKLVDQVRRNRPTVDGDE